MLNILLTCPPMILRFNYCKDKLKEYNVDIPDFTQTMTEDELITIIDKYDIWIAGDDPVTRKVLKKANNLKYVIKWGIGTDNIDFSAIKDLNLKFNNTPGMFGDEVADVAIGYLINITRHLNEIDRENRKGNWYKPSGVSLRGKKVSLIGFGNIGRNIGSRLLALKMNVFVSDPGFEKINGKIICKYNPDLEICENLNQIEIVDVNNALKNSQFIILSCPLLDSTKYLINKNTINILSDNCYIVNVSRGPIVNEKDVVEALENGKIAGFASDVFEIEPISINHELMKFNNVIMGSHNASNTIDAVDETNLKVIKLINNFKSEYH